MIWGQLVKWGVGVKTSLWMSWGGKLGKNLRGICPEGGGWQMSGRKCQNTNYIHHTKVNINQIVLHNNQHI